MHCNSRPSDVGPVVLGFNYENRLMHQSKNQQLRNFHDHNAPTHQILTQSAASYLPNASAALDRL